MSRTAIPASLEQFARTGQLGPFACGMTRDAVFAAVGAPDDWFNGQLVERSGLWKYGDAELHIDPQSDRVCLIHFDWFKVPQCGGGIDLDPWVIRRGLPATVLEAALHGCGIGFDSRPDPVNPDCVLIASAGGVLFVVGIQGDADLGLCVFGRGTAA